MPPASSVSSSNRVDSAAVSGASDSADLVSAFLRFGAGLRFGLAGLASCVSSSAIWVSSSAMRPSANFRVFAVSRCFARSVLLAVSSFSRSARSAFAGEAAAFTGALRAVVTLLGLAVLVRRAVVRVVLAGLLAAAFTVVFAGAFAAVLVFFAAAVRAGAARRTAVERPVLRAFAAGFLF